MKAFHDRSSPRYLSGLIRKALRKVVVVLLNNIEHRLLGEPAMILGKQLMHAASSSSDMDCPLRKAMLWMSSQRGD